MGNFFVYFLSTQVEESFPSGEAHSACACFNTEESEMSQALLFLSAKSVLCFWKFLLAEAQTEVSAQFGEVFLLLFLFMPM